MGARDISRYKLMAVFLFWFMQTVCAQEVDLEHGVRLKWNGSKETAPAWSADGKRLAFQSNRFGNWDIFVYDLVRDTIERWTSKQADERRPVFDPRDGSLVYDAQQDNKVYIYKIDALDRRQKELFHRPLLCKGASFSPSGRVMAFLGYDKAMESWQIYTYDFIYGNLNRLTKSDKQLFLPKFSPDGKTILFGEADKLAPVRYRLLEISWYGEQIAAIDSVDGKNYGWSGNGFRVFAVQKKGVSNYQLVSFRKDGTFKISLLSGRYPVYAPAVSPDGTKLALAVDFNGETDIVILDLTAD